MPMGKCGGTGALTEKYKRALEIKDKKKGGSEMQARLGSKF